MNQPSEKKIIIAIDGFSSSGKSSMARQLAKSIGYRYIDSGAMYRAVTLYAIEHGYVAPGRDPDVDAVEASLPHIHISFAIAPDSSQITELNGRNVEQQIRSMAVSQCVSPIAAIPQVRHALVAMQQQLGRDKGIVMDGRDIGTTVFPDAEMKIYVNASPQTRAQRRLAELVEKGVATSFEEVLANVISRDHIDRTRAESPLRKAPDAIELDNSTMSIAQQDAWLIDQYHRIAGLK